MQLGINAMFSSAADFSSIFHNRAGNMRISKVQHKAFIDVNEIGCEAAAASGKLFLPYFVVAGGEWLLIFFLFFLSFLLLSCNTLFPVFQTVAVGVPMSLPLDPKTFVADHPFAFIIRDKTAVYFAGHIVKF